MRNGVNAYLQSLGEDTESSLEQLEQQRSTLLENASQVFDVLPDNIRNAAASANSRVLQGEADGSDVARVLVQH